MTPTELSHLSITEAASGLRRKEFSPKELAQACLEIIESVDGKLHSFITVTADLALEQARKAEQELRAGTDKGPLHGIPIALKDLYATKNIRTTCHSAVLQDWVPDHDATTVTKLREAGTILLGKLGMHELRLAGHPSMRRFLRFVIRGIQRTSREVRAAAQVQPLPLDCVWAL